MRSGRMVEESEEEKVRAGEEDVVVGDGRC